MQDNYFIVDIETVPNDLDKYLSLEEDKRTELLNSIDSKIWAIGIRYKEFNKLFYGNDEKDILERFWDEMASIMEGKPLMNIVGFNITNFDIPFIISRSFINNIKIRPFSLKQVIDLRDKINAYRYGKTRGKLKEYAKLIGLNILDIDGKDVALLYKNNEMEKLKDYLSNDLFITDEILKRTIYTGIINIRKW